jgi:hypothetical protein
MIYLNFFGFTDFFSYICKSFVNIDIVINKYCYELMNKYTYLYTNTSVRFLRETAGQTKGVRD